MAGAELRKVDALLHLRDALIRFRDSTTSIPSQLRARIERAEAALARQTSFLQTEIQTQRAVLSESDDEDERDDAQRDLDEAIEQLSTTRARARTLAAAVARHNRVAASWQHTTGEKLPAATAFLAGRHAEAVGYQRVASSGGHRTHSSGASEHTVTGMQAIDGSADPMSADSPDDLPRLPEGFSWIPIGQFSRSELPGKGDFKKVGYLDMAAGLQRLWSELIPTLNGSDHTNRSVCERFDEANGRVDPMGFIHPESIANLWDKFFDPRFKEHIRVTYDEATDRWGIDNGRHRIKAAGDLGWKYVPGELLRHSSEMKDDRGQAERSYPPG
jgi:hypothetical protein